MGRTAAWRTEELGWVCGNTDWRNTASYALGSSRRLDDWAWEFLRRNSRYRAAVDGIDSPSPEQWGLASLVNYNVPATGASEAAKARWLALQAYQLFVGNGPLPNVEKGQVALIFDVRRRLPIGVLQRQLGELANYLHEASGRTWVGVTEKNRKGGRKYDPESLLPCLRFADAIAHSRDIDSEELADVLALASPASRRLNEIYNKARSLIGGDYLRLVDQALSSMRHTPRALKIGDQPSW